MNIVNQALFENANMILITPILIKKVKQIIKKISYNAWERLPENDIELEDLINQKLEEIDTISGIGSTMIITRSELRDERLIPNKISSVGCHWSWHSDSSQVYDSDNATEKNLVNISLEGEIQFKDIDWVFTIATNLALPQEREIKVKLNSKVHLYTIYNNTNNKEYNVDYSVICYGGF